jgi:RNA polymerase sigma-70 factor, ECF subfamily
MWRQSGLGERGKRHRSTTFGEPVMSDSIVDVAWTQHREPLLAYARSMTRDADSAEDIVQEAFARLAREVKLGRTPDHVRAWLYRVTRNLRVSDGRRGQTANRYLSVLHEDFVLGSVEDEVLDIERGREIRAVLAGLPAHDRTALVMAALGYTGAEIGRVIGCSEAALRTRICRLRTRLRQEFLNESVLAYADSRATMLN